MEATGFFLSPFQSRQNHHLHIVREDEPPPSSFLKPVLRTQASPLWHNNNVPSRKERKTSRPRFFFLLFFPPAVPFSIGSTFFLILNNGSAHMSWGERKRGRKRKRRSRRRKKRLHATMMMMVLLTRTMRRRRSCETVDLYSPPLLFAASWPVEQKRRRGNNKSKERREGEGRGTCSAGSILRLDRRSRCLLIFPCCCSPALSSVRPFFLPHVLLHFTQWGGGGDSPDPFPRVNWWRPSIHHIPSCKSVSPSPIR